MSGRKGRDNCREHNEASEMLSVEAALMFATALAGGGKLVKGTEEGWKGQGDGVTV